MTDICDLTIIVGIQSRMSICCSQWSLFERLNIPNAHILPTIELVVNQYPSQSNFKRGDYECMNMAGTDRGMFTKISRFRMQTLLFRKYVPNVTHTCWTGGNPSYLYMTDAHWLVQSTYAPTRQYTDSRFQQTLDLISVCSTRYVIVVVLFMLFGTPQIECTPVTPTPGIFNSMLLSVTVDRRTANWSVDCVRCMFNMNTAKYTIRCFK